MESDEQVSSKRLRLQPLKINALPSICILLNSRKTVMVERYWFRPHHNALKVMHLHSNACRALKAFAVIASFLAVSACFGVETNTFLRLHFQTNSAGTTFVQYGERIATSLTNATQLLNFTKLVENKGTNS